MEKTFTDIKDHAKYLVDKCWIPLSNFNEIKPSVLKKLDVLKLDVDLRKTDEITLLGELATYSRDTIGMIPGIGEKTLNTLEKVLVKNDLYWETSMEAIRILAGDL